MVKAHTSNGPGTIDRLADWVLAVRAEDLPAATVNQAKLLALDAIGCGFAALEEESARAVLETLGEVGGAPQCTVIGRKQKTSVPMAVLVNGALIRILDLNDYMNTKAGQIGGHPSDNIPVALAAGESAGASGREIIAAIAIGYEIYGRFKEVMNRDSDWDGVTVSGMSAPAMAGRLMGLDRGRLAQAMALSAARAATPLAVRHGDISAAKSVSNALVAQNGVQAAMLARHGMTGPLDLFENPHGLRALFPKIDGSQRLTEPLGADCYLMSANVKAFPCLATGQSVVQAALDVYRQINGDSDSIRHIKLSIADMPFLHRQKDDPGRMNPTSREAADHSFNFLATVPLLDGEFGLAQFDNERWNDPKVRAMMAKLEIVCDSSLNALSPGSFPSAVEVTTADGRTHRSVVPDPPGFSRNGVKAEDVVRKFHAITKSRLSQAARDRIVDAATTLDKAPSPAKLMDALANALPA